MNMTRSLQNSSFLRVNPQKRHHQLPNFKNSATRYYNVVVIFITITITRSCKNANEPQPPKMAATNVKLIASFDIGKKNFAHYVEELSDFEIETLKNEYKSFANPKLKRIDVQHERYPSFLENVYKTGKRIQTGVYDLRNENKENVLDVETRLNIINHIRRFDHVWKQCEVFIIEKQYIKAFSGRRRKNTQGGSQINVMAIKIAELVLSVLIANYPTATFEYEFGSNNKTQLLNAPRGLGDKERKKFDVDEAEKLYRLRNDVSMIELFRLKSAVSRKTFKTEAKIEAFICSFVPSSKQNPEIRELALKVVDKQKFDDFCDSCMQLQAYKIKLISGRMG